MYGCIRFTGACGRTGQCSDIAADETKSEPGAGLLGNVKTMQAHRTGLGGAGRVCLGGPGLRGLGGV